MADWAKFLETAGLLYSMWPGLFNWIAGLILPIIVAFVTAAWWIRGKIAETRETALIGEIALLNQRLALSRDLQSIADAEAKKLGAELADGDGDISKDIPVYDQRKFAASVDALHKLIDATTAVSKSLKSEGAKVSGIISMGPPPGKPRK